MTGLTRSLVDRENADFNLYAEINGGNISGLKKDLVSTVKIPKIVSFPKIVIFGDFFLKAHNFFHS
jgi:hypothetical protein